MSTKLFLGGIIAFVLLAIYVYLAWTAISIVGCPPESVCHTSFTKPMASALALIGGLVSALVITELAITKSGETPFARAMGSSASTTEITIIKVATYAYLAVWTLVGLVAFLVALKNPDELQSLTALGQSWLGLAVAAGYSYFGLNRQE